MQTLVDIFKTMFKNPTEEQTQHSTQNRQTTTVNVCNYQNDYYGDQKCL